MTVITGKKASILESVVSRLYNKLDLEGERGSKPDS